MDATQRRRIEQMRSTGASYSHIAAATDLSINTVKSYCRRNNMSTEVLPDTPAAFGTMCNNCGFPLEKDSHKRFCSDTCRKAYWKSHPEQLNRKTQSPSTCAHCGAIFLAYGNKKRKYCSHTCYIAARFGKAAK